VANSISFHHPVSFRFSCFYYLYTGPISLRHPVRPWWLNQTQVCNDSTCLHKPIVQWHTDTSRPLFNDDTLTLQDHHSVTHWHLVWYLNDHDFSSTILVIIGSLLLRCFILILFFKTSLYSLRISQESSFLTGSWFTGDKETYASITHHILSLLSPNFSWVPPLSIFVCTCSFSCFFGDPSLSWSRTHSLKIVM